MTFVTSMIGKAPLSGNLRKILSNSGWLFADKFLRMGLNFVLNAWIAQYLGAELFGVWNYSIAFVALFSFLSTMGLYSVVIRDVVSSPGQEHATLGAALVIRLAGGMATLLGAGATIALTRPDSPLIHSLVLITGLGYLVQSLDVIDYYFQSQLKARLIVYARTLAFVPVAAVKVYFIWRGYPVGYFAWAAVAELLLGAILLVVIYQRHYTRLRHWRFDPVVVRRLLRSAAPLLLSEIAIILYMRLDQIMLGNLVSNQAVGNYSAAVRLSEVWYLFPNIICSSVFPSIIQARGDDVRAYYNKLQHLYNLMVWLAAAIGLVVTFAAPALTNLFYGAEFAGAAPILTIHIWTGVFVFLGIASGQYLIIENLSNIAFYRTLAGLLANLVLNFLLIPRYHEVGAAVATLLSQACAAYLFDACNQSTRRMFLMKTKSFFPFLPISHAKF